MKWRNGFKCPRCGHDQCWEGPKPFHKVCKSCRHGVSPTADTLFHKVKFGLRKAFCIVFEMTSTTKSLSSIQMAKRYHINQKTAWLFMHKVWAAMKSSAQHPVEGKVQVDDFLIGGGKERNKPGKSKKSKKKILVMATELTANNHIKRDYPPLFPENTNALAFPIDNPGQTFSDHSVKYQLIF